MRILLDNPRFSQMIHHPPAHDFFFQWGNVRVDTTNGTDAACFDPTAHNIIVVFGGPGCCKGRVTSILANEFGFDLISMETVVSD